MGKLPKVLSFIFLIEIIQRLNYWGIQSIILLYLINNFILPKNQAYLIYSAFTALTFIMSIIGGLMADRLFGFRNLFLLGVISSLGGFFLFTWLCLYLLNQHLFMNRTQHIKSPLLFYSLNITLLCAISFFIYYPSFVEKALYSIGISVLLISIIVLYRRSYERVNIILLMIMISLMLLFFACTFQIYTSLTIYIDHYINRSLFGWTLPASIFPALEPLFVVLLSPLVIQFWKMLKKEFSPIQKLGIGLCLGGSGFGIFAFSAFLSSPSIIWILIGNLFLGLGELCIVPPLISAISTLAPQSLKGTIMGALYLSLAFSGYFAGKIAEITATTEISSIGYSALYAKLGIFIFVIGIISIISKFIFNQCMLHRAATVRERHENYVF